MAVFRWIQSASRRIGSTASGTSSRMRAVIALAPRRVLCLDTSFRGNDEIKTNTVLEMRDHEINFQTV